MWTWRRMLKISWTETVTNEEVLVRPNEASSIMEMIWHRKHRWLGHVLRHDNLLNDIIKGKMLDKANRGRIRMELLHDMMERRDYGQLKDLKHQTDQNGDRTASENACQKHDGNNTRLKKKNTEAEVECYPAGSFC